MLSASIWNKNSVKNGNKNEWRFFGHFGLVYIVDHCVGKRLNKIARCFSCYYSMYLSRCVCSNTIFIPGLTTPIPFEFILMTFWVCRLDVESKWLLQTFKYAFKRNLYLHSWLLLLLSLRILFLFVFSEVTTFSIQFSS